ncbi:tape measure protein [Avibacterium paragallinarum]|uniref:tape measure protein n=1 Tax=Avibacterium paragallinarum TaxID=728 RepID=UPI00188FE778|nr:tape measure protein [Avibacterium paragallinarum]QZP14628.1 tape measure protein [Avibacterium paragallinarum]WAL56340.1 tape measure protein [Avibacterium paragallinarum]WAM58925.1 tape measure protein [Avibacterium paragallinarum]
MNVIRELVTVLKYKVDNSKLKGYITQTQTAAGQIRGKLRNALRGAAQESRAIGEGINQAKTHMLSLRNMIGGYFAMVAGGNVIKIADDWAAVDSRVKLATKSAEEHKHALDEIFAISQRSGQDYLASADLFSKVNRNAGDLGLSLDDTLNLTEIIGQTMTIGGGDPAAQQAALMQLGQALGSGALRGDELNSIIEQAPRLANAIADSFGVPIGQLKDLGKEGKLTSKELAQGLLRQAEKIQKEFDQMPKTFGRGMTLLRNKAGQLIDRVVNKASKLGETFYNAAEWITKNIRLVGILATSAIGAKLLPMLNATKLSLKQIIINGTRAAAPFLAMAAALTAVGLVLEDIYGWTQGDISLTGALIGRFDQWADKFQAVGKLANSVWLNIKGLLRDIAKLANVDLDLSDWQGFATSVMNYVIDGLKNLIKTAGSVVRIIRALVNGDFSGAFSNAGKLIDGLSLKFLPFYSIALTVISGIISLLWAIFSPLKLLGKAFFSVGTIIGKGFKFAIFIIKPFISILLFTKKAIFLVGKTFLFASKMMIKAIWAVARAMFVAMASNPILLAIGLVLGAIALLIIYWDDVKRIALAVWDAISTKASETWEGVKTTATNKWNEVTNTFKNAWQQSIDTVVGWFESLIPSWIKDLFSSGAKAEVNVTGAAMVTPTSQYVQPTSTLPSYTKYGGNMQSNVTQTNNFNIQGATNPTGVANAVSGKLKQNRPAPFGVGSIEYAG